MKHAIERLKSVAPFVLITSLIVLVAWVEIQKGECSSACESAGMTYYTRTVNECRCVTVSSVVVIP